MRWTGWILAAIAVVHTGLASGGQPGCAGCGGGSAGWQGYQGALSGEACYSPPGYSTGYAAHPGNCGENQRPCCNNAWDGYCAHHARVQAFWTQVGVPKTRCCPAAVRRMPMRPCAESSAPAVQQTPAVAPVPASPSAPQPTPAAAPLPPPPSPPPTPPPAPVPPPPGEPPTPSDEAFQGIGQSWMR
jgi:hypothetical protein